MVGGGDSGVSVEVEACDDESVVGGVEELAVAELESLRHVDVE